MGFADKNVVTQIANKLWSKSGAVEIIEEELRQVVYDAFVHIAYEAMDEGDGPLTQQQADGVIYGIYFVLSNPRFMVTGRQVPDGVR